MSRCDHKFVDSRECLKCGVSVDELRRASDAELLALGGRAPNETRALSDKALADRYPQLDAAWRPVVQWAALSSELAGVTYGANWLQLHYQLGPLSSSLMLMLAQVTQVRASDPPLWKDRIEQTLLRLRLARAQLDVVVSSVEERDERARRRRADELEEIEGHGDQ